jgi:hypothetical protein
MTDWGDNCLGHISILSFLRISLYCCSHCELERDVHKITAGVRWRSGPATGVSARSAAVQYSTTAELSRPPKLHPRQEYCM